MSGKRERKRAVWKLRAAFLLLVTLSVVMTPLVTASEPAAQDFMEQSVEFSTPIVHPQEPEPQKPEPAVPDVQQPPESDAQPPEPLSTPVEDSYFSDAVFIGDSRTEGLSLYAGLSQPAYLFARGATVESVRTKATEQTASGKEPIVDALSALEVQKIYVMLGVNELGWVYGETYYDQYAKLIEAIRQSHPQAQIALQTLPPVNEACGKLPGYINNQRIGEYNDLIRQLAQDQDCTYLDVASVFTGEDGRLPPEMTSDGVHLSVSGCKVWREYLENHPI